MTITGKNPILKSFVLLAPNSKNPKSSNLVSPDCSLALKCSYASNAALNCSRIAKILNYLNSLFVIFANKNFPPVVAETSKEKSQTQKLSHLPQKCQVAPLQRSFMLRLLN
jgi:hypothetical protein